MTKKKICSRLIMAMMMAIVCAGFTSCGDDNDEPEAPATWGSSYVVTFELSDGVMNTADITAHIANPDGTFREEKVTKTKSTWTLTGNKLPDKAGVLLTFVPKKNIDESNVYEIGIKGSITTTGLRNDQVVDYKSDSNDSNLSIKGDKLTQYYVGKGVGFAAGVGENGKIVSVDVESFDFGLNGLWEWVAGWLK